MCSTLLCSCHASMLQSQPLACRRVACQVVLPDRLSEEVRRLLDWHWSQLEYGCSAPLSKVKSDQAAANACLLDTHT